MKTKNICDTDKPADKLIDKRVQRSQEVVLAATQELMSEEGIAGFSVDEVSRRSGVSKTTIYRHWASRSALLVDACSHLNPCVEQVNTGSLRGDVTTLAAYLAHKLQSSRGATVMPSVIDAAEHDPEMACLLAEMHTRFLFPFVAAAAHAQERGELPLDYDPAAFADAFLAPFFYRRWFSRQPLDEAFVQGIIRSMVGPLGEE